MRELTKTFKLSSAAKKAAKKAVMALAASSIFAGIAFAQAPSLPGPPYNVDLGAIVTNTARGPSTFNSPQQTNLAYNGVACTFNMVGSSGGPSTTFGIQFYDSASATYQTLATSGAVTALNTPTTVVVAPGIQNVVGGSGTISAYPTGFIALGMHLPRFWRVTETITGVGTTVTGTIGCNVFR